VKKIKGKKRIEKSFYTNEEFEEWKEKLDFDIDDWLVKYYKVIGVDAEILNRRFTDDIDVQGLGTSSHHEAEDYFNHLDRHQKPFRQLQPGERELIQMAFSKNRSDERKEWIRNHQVRYLLNEILNYVNRQYSVIEWYIHGL
jgi:DNA topoisomerase-2